MAYSPSWKTSTEPLMHPLPTAPISVGFQSLLLFRSNCHERPTHQHPSPSCCFGCQHHTSCSPIFYLLSPPAYKSYAAARSLVLQLGASSLCPATGNQCAVSDWEKQALIDCMVLASCNLVTAKLAAFHYF